MISYAVSTVTFEIEIWLKLQDRDFSKNPETRDVKICAFCRIFLNFVITSKMNFFEFLAVFQPVLFVSYLLIQQKNVVAL